MNNKLLKDYAEVRSQIDELSQKEATLKKSIVVEMEKEGISNAETNLGMFVLAELKSWSFSKDLNAFAEEIGVKVKKFKDKIAKLNDEVKVKETEEKESGTAKAEVRKSLRFTPSKDGE